MVRDGKVVQRNLGICFSMVGGLLLCAALVVSLYFGSKSTGYIKTKATVTKKTNHSYIEYDRNGISYQNTLSYTSSAHREGSELTIWVDPDHPYQIFSYERLVIPLALGGLGIAFSLLGLGFTIYVWQVRRQQKQLLGQGTKVDAQILDVKVNLMVQRRRQHPYVIHCSWQDPETGNDYFFRSDNLWRDPGPTIQEQKLKTLPVYLNPERKRNYLISLSAFQEDSNQAS